MECDLCIEQFDGAERVPKVLPCGHTACLQCLRRLPDRSCPTCRRDFNGPPEGLPPNFTVLKFLEGRRLDSTRSTPSTWCSDCRAAATPRCSEDHDVLPIRKALTRHLQDALPQAAEQLQGLQDQCRDDQVLPALTLLTVESWEVSLRGGGHELTGTLRNTEYPLMKALWLLLAERAALTENRAATRRDPPPAAAPSPSAAAPTQGPPSAAAPAPSAAALTPTQGPPPAECHRGPAWSLALQQRAAPSLKQLSVHHPSEDHLRAVRAMPRLRRLHVTASPDPRAPALPSPGYAGLKWLSVWGLPRHILESMLKAHGASLEEVQLSVGAKALGYCYPYGGGVSELPSLLQRSNLRAMRKLVLKRRFIHHDAEDCVRQRASARLHLDGAEVLCDQCDGVVAEEL